MGLKNGPEKYKLKKKKGVRGRGLGGGVMW